MKLFAYFVFFNVVWFVAPNFVGANKMVSYQMTRAEQLVVLLNIFVSTNDLPLDVEIPVDLRDVKVPGILLLSFPQISKTPENWK